MIDMSHHRYNRRPGDTFPFLQDLISLQLLLNTLFFFGFCRVSQLLNNEDGCVLVQRLVNGDHHAHIHQDLDDFSGLDG